MNRVYLALGSNLGDRGEWIAFGVRALTGLEPLSVARITAPIETVPLGGLDQPAYLNAMISGAWEGTALALLEACHQIEASTGRTRERAWASRELDIDIVRFGDQLRDGPTLTLPHPGLRDRTFWARQIVELEQHD